MSNFLYNGMAFPEPPEWDKKTYPYAAITCIISGLIAYFAEFLYSTEPFVYNTETGYCTPPESATVYRRTSDVYNNTKYTEWGKPYTVPEMTKRYSGRDYVWTNTDIYSDNGALFLGATEPVPLAEVTGGGRYARYSPGPEKDGWSSFKCPVLPAWDMVKYPYAVISGDVADGFGFYILYLSDKPFCFKSPDELIVIDSPGSTVLACKYATNFEVGMWDKYLPVYPQGLTYNVYIHGLSQLVWTNTDICRDSGKVVFEYVPPIKFCDIKGWLTGFFLAMAGKPQPVTIRDVIYDNEWPITWSYPEMLANFKSHIAAASAYLVKVSDLVPTKEEVENMVLDVTENGLTSTLKFEETLTLYGIEFITMCNDSGVEYSLYVVHTADNSISSMFPTTGIYVEENCVDTSEKKYTLRLAEDVPEPDVPDVPLDPIVGDASGLQYAFDQNTLQLDITDTGVEGDTFSLVGDTLTVNYRSRISFTINDVAFQVYEGTTWAEWAASDDNTFVHPELGGEWKIVAHDMLGLVLWHIGASTLEYYPICYESGEVIDYDQSLTPIPNGAVLYVVTKNMISFTIDGIELQAEEGMTWGQWCDSEYNSGFSSSYNYSFDEYGSIRVRYFSSGNLGLWVFAPGYVNQYTDTVIMANTQYFTDM